MAKLEEITVGAKIKGIVHDEQVEVSSLRWFGENVLEVTYRTQNGQVAPRLLYRDDESGLSVVQPGQPWAFDEDGDLFRLVSEARRINLAHLFDPLLAVHTSVVDPLPHQITAVYESMLPRQPLRFLLADDPGAGKTIMAGLLLKELIARGDVERCLICCPGSLVDQWQDEMWRRFALDFKIISRQAIDDSKTGNPFAENPLTIGRLDHLSRNEKVHEMIHQVEWDLVVVDEAHKMSAHYYGNEVKETKRFQLGRDLGAAERTRHFLLMTATPHNGKEEDFQLFMSLLDGDRFEGKFRDGVHTVDVTDLMRRMVKEDLVKFDGTPLFPERRAYTVTYDLSDLEAKLYAAVTKYVCNEMNRADLIEGGARQTRIGFALTTLQRRLASSPEAIYQSIKRRRERLEDRIREAKINKRGLELLKEDSQSIPILNADDLLDLDSELDDATEEEVTEAEEIVVEQASAAQTIAELQAEIETLVYLESLAAQVRASKTDRKWEELSRLLQNQAEMFDSRGHRRKLIVFTEHRATLDYLYNNITTLIGKSEAVVTIHGGKGREEKRRIQEEFLHNKDVLVLIATDAAGEGINLQRAHLMVNYDLPWNPNRLEQRFGRIHRIGQTEVCHMWSLVAHETREGEVYERLLKKLEAARKALGGGVFDVLGSIFKGAELRKLLIEAIRYGEDPEVKKKLWMKIDGPLDQDYLRTLVEDRALATETLSSSRVRDIREYMERTEARKLQPHFIRSFFIKAFEQLGGRIHQREKGRYEITHVPPTILQADWLTGHGVHVLRKYERVCFEKEFVTVDGKPLAMLLCPGHPLLDATVDVILRKYRNILKRGAILVDETDQSNEIRALYFLEHSIQDGKQLPHGGFRIISKRMQFVEIREGHRISSAGYAPYLDYRAATPDEHERLQNLVKANWLQGDLEPVIIEYAVQHLVPEHLKEVRTRRLDFVNRTEAAVKDRLTREINDWDHRSNVLKDQELAGKPAAGLNSAMARRRADDLEARLQKRVEELSLERQISALTPVVLAGAIVVPAGLLTSIQTAQTPDDLAADAESRKEIEERAMAAVLDVEKTLGYEPVDRSEEKCGYDIESRDPRTGRLRFIEVKGRAAGATTVSVTKNEILTALNKPDDFILALGVVDGDSTEVRYIRKPFKTEPDFAVTCEIFDLTKLLSISEVPS